MSLNSINPLVFIRDTQCVFSWLLCCLKAVHWFPAQHRLFFPRRVFLRYRGNVKSRDSSVGIATGYVLDDRGVGVRVPVGQEFSLLHLVQTGSGVHPTSYLMGTRG
jgi:hypothetical protein